MFTFLIRFSFANILSADEVYTLIFCSFHEKRCSLTYNQARLGKKIKSIVCEKTSFHYLPVGAVISQATRPRENRELNTQMHTRTHTDIRLFEIQNSDAQTEVWKLMISCAAEV